MLSFSSILNFVIYCLYFWLALQIVAGEVNIGDDCPMNSNKIGRCVLMKNCPNATRSDYYQICGFLGSQTIICCGTLKTIGEISKERCLEYGKYSYENLMSPTLSTAESKINVSVCGIPTALIIGGTYATRREFPHLALLGYGQADKKRWLCSGTLISQQHVMTAAHCLDSATHGSVNWVRLGIYHLGSRNDHELREYSISERIAHPEYRTPSIYNDIAILKLEKFISLNKYIKPACLPTANEEKLPRRAFLTGWNLERHAFTGTNGAMIRLVLDIYKRDVCKNYFINITKLQNGFNEETQICAGVGEREIKDLCPGDSGGPLQIYNKDVHCTYTIIGVASFGNPCQSNTHAIFTRVSNYLEWIVNIVWK